MRTGRRDQSSSDTATSRFPSLGHHLHLTAVRSLSTPDPRSSDEHGNGQTTHPCDTEDKMACPGPRIAPQPRWEHELRAELLHCVLGGLQVPYLIAIDLGVARVDLHVGPLLHVHRLGPLAVFLTRFLISFIHARGVDVEAQTRVLVHDRAVVSKDPQLIAFPVARVHLYVGHGAQLRGTLPLAVLLPCLLFLRVRTGRIDVQAQARCLVDDRTLLHNEILVSLIVARPEHYVGLLLDFAGLQPFAARSFLAFCARGLDIHAHFCNGAHKICRCVAKHNAEANFRQAAHVERTTAGKC
mmetsp:Transcript_117479/g.379144  ORF Transcript_117479/g.379144 Transcript_117479/m.379144 type:complete len:298 (-) Transcript_117479:44-937(-)